jgi:hypothetical protein
MPNSAVETSAASGAAKERQHASSGTPPKVPQEASPPLTSADLDCIFDLPYVNGM